jgi:hypothetical protein
MKTMRWPPPMETGRFRPWEMSITAFGLDKAEFPDLRLGDVRLMPHSCGDQVASNSEVRKLSRSLHA